MAWVLKPLRIESLEDAVFLLNRTSRGREFQQDIDLQGFLVLSRFWEFSYRHSLLAYSGGEPAGILLGSVNATRGDAFTYYWGVLAPFRNQRLSMAMVSRYLGGLKDAGLRRAISEATSDAPSVLYRKLGFEMGDELVKLEYLESQPPPFDLNYQVLPISAADAAGQYRADLPGADYWIRRPEFRQRLAKHLLHAGVLAGGTQTGFATFETRTDRTLVADYHLPDPESAAAWTRYAFERGYTRPLVFPAAHPDTASCASLVECGYTVTGRFRTMTLDLTRPNQRLTHLYRSFPDLPLRDQRHHA